MRPSVSTEFLQFLPQEPRPTDPRSQGQGEGLWQSLERARPRTDAVNPSATELGTFLVAADLGKRQRCPDPWEHSV